MARAVGGASLARRTMPLWPFDLAPHLLILRSLVRGLSQEVRTVDEMAAVLETGTLLRSTASTHMNSRSSRSHAIYTITVEQRKQQQQQPGGAGVSPVALTGGAEDEEEAEEDGEELLDDYLCAKMHLVGLRYGTGRIRAHPGEATSFDIDLLPRALDISLPTLSPTLQPCLVPAVHQIRTRLAFPVGGWTPDPQTLPAPCRSI